MAHHSAALTHGKGVRSNRRAAVCHMQAPPPMCSLIQGSNLLLIGPALCMLSGIQLVLTQDCMCHLLTSLGHGPYLVGLSERSGMFLLGAGMAYTMLYYFLTCVQWLGSRCLGRVGGSQWEFDLGLVLWALHVTAHTHILHVHPRMLTIYRWIFLEFWFRLWNLRSSVHGW